MTDEKSPDLQAVSQKLAEDMMNVTIHLQPRPRDVRFGRNPFGYSESVYVWFRYVLVPLPGTFLHGISNILTFLSKLSLTVGACFIGILLSLVQMFIIPIAQTIMGLTGSVRVRYTETTVRECFLESIRKLPSYAEFIKAGGVFREEVIVLTPGFTDRVRETIEHVSKESV